MSRINTNIPSLVASRVLAQNTQKLNTTLQRLSTGLRINSGKDDPAGLIASEGLRSQITGINAAIDNANRADSVVSIAEGGLTEVNSLLTDLQGLVDRSANKAGLSDDEVKANQIQIDSILDSINRIANATNFNGKKLLDGSLDYTTSGVTTGPSASAITDLKVNSARLANNSSRNVTVQVTQSAQTGELLFTGSSVGASTVTIQVAGNTGSDVFTFAASTAVSAVVAAVNASKSLTGVSASLSGTGAIKFDSVGYGSDSFVSVAALNGTFAVTGGSSATRDEGQDAGVLINGATATVKGLKASVHTAGLDADITLAAAFATQTAAGTSFAITGGGATFSIGAELGINADASLGIGNINTATIGDGSLGFLNTLGSGLANDLSSGNFATAQKIVNAAANEVSSLRGRLGAFQKNTLGSTINSLQIALENTTAAESAIRDTDFATETSNLTRAQILQQAAQAALQLANQAPTSVLGLLR
jgi:flagellin